MKLGDEAQADLEPRSQIRTKNSTQITFIIRLGELGDTSHGRGGCSLSSGWSLCFCDYRSAPASVVLQVGYDCEMVLLFECPEDVMLERLRGRGQGRSDDNEETIRKRVQVRLLMIICW